MLFTAVTLALLGQALAGPVELEERQSSCPNIHVFGARETTAPTGYGSSSTAVNLILNAYPGSTSEAINYPACGGQSSCGGVSYANSVVAGINAVVSAVNFLIRDVQTLNSSLSDTLRYLFPQIEIFSHV